MLRYNMEALLIIILIFDFKLFSLKPLNVAIAVLKGMVTDSWKLINILNIQSYDIFRYTFFICLNAIVSYINIMDNFPPKPFRYLNPPTGARFSYNSRILISQSFKNYINCTNYYFYFNSITNIFYIIIISI